MVFMKDAAESISPLDGELVELLCFGDRLGEWAKGRCGMQGGFVALFDRSCPWSRLLVWGHTAWVSSSTAVATRSFSGESAASSQWPRRMF